MPVWNEKGGGGERKSKVMGVEPVRSGVVLGSVAPMDWNCVAVTETVWLVVADRSRAGELLANGAEGVPETLTWKVG
jgi:hypothetical protein